MNKGLATLFFIALTLTAVSAVELDWDKVKDSTRTGAAYKLVFSLIGVFLLTLSRSGEISDNPLFFLLRLDVHMNIARYVLRSTKLDLLHKTLACDGCNYSKVVISIKKPAVGSSQP